MQAVALKILGAVLALRRFTIEELVEFAGIKPTTAASWLRRHGEFFEKSTWRSSAVRGRPRMLHVLTPRGVEELTAVLDPIPSTRLEEAFGTLQSAPRRLASLHQARAFARLLGEWGPADELHAARENLGIWIASAGRQMQNLASAGIPIHAPDVLELNHLERLYEKAVPWAASSGPPFALLSEEILGTARGCIKRVQVSPGFLGDDLAGLIRPHNARSASRLLGVLAALGVVEELPLIPENKRAIVSLASAIGDDDCVVGLQQLRDGLGISPTGRVALLLVLNGIRRHMSLLASSLVADWLDGFVEQADWEAPLMGAYLRTRLSMAGCVRQHVMCRVARLHEAARPGQTDEQISFASAADAFERAAEDVELASEEYALQAMSVHRVMMPAMPDLKRFEMQFFVGAARARGVA